MLPPKPVVGIVRANVFPVVSEVAEMEATLPMVLLERMAKEPEAREPEAESTI